MTILFASINIILGLICFIGFFIGILQECSDTSYRGVPSGIFVAIISACLIIMSLMIFGVLESNNIITLDVHRENWIFDIFNK